jgi:hypothetical protein
MSRRLLWPLLGILLGGCGQSFQPLVQSRLLPQSHGRAAEVAAYKRFCGQFGENRNLPIDRQRHIVILLMTPAYGTLRQISAGNMGHAAIEINGTMHDMGSMNGYAFAFSPTPGLRDWDFPDADSTLSRIVGHADSDGYLDEITRFDVTITDDQADRLQSWWEQMEAAMRDPGNRLYCWNGWQCASTVAQSLRDAGVILIAPDTPGDLNEYLRENLRNTCGKESGRPAMMKVVQPAACLQTQANRTTNFLGLLLRLPRIFFAGTRSAILIDGLDGRQHCVLWSDSPEYRREIQNAPVNPTAAVKLAIEKENLEGAQAVPNFMLGRWYHVDDDHVIGQASIGGWYVNADTGEVRHRDDARVIRFDLFDGDRVVASWETLRK